MGWALNIFWRICLAFSGGVPLPLVLLNWLRLLACQKWCCGVVGIFAVCHWVMNSSMLCSFIGVASCPGWVTLWSVFEVLFILKFGCWAFVCHISMMFWLVSIAWPNSSPVGAYKSMLSHFSWFKSLPL